jgi:N,N'-diacetyllegionaminate synthase
VNIGNSNTDSAVYIIAEIGNNHEGDFELAKEMIHLAKETKVDAVKFQTFITEEYIGKDDPERFQRIKSYELSQDQFAELSAIAKDLEMGFISTPFDIESAKFLSTIADALKISSGDNNFHPLIEILAKFEKPIILSTGMASLEDVLHCRDLIIKISSENDIDHKLAILHCVSSYPVEKSDANLRAITTLIKEVNEVVGYSDHTIGPDAAVLAVALGARIIEKHFTIDKKISEFRDHQLSADPAEMRETVRRIRETEKMLGTGEKKVEICEKDCLASSRRSIIANKDISPGAEITWGDLSWVRPSGGLEPGREGEILGKKALKAISKGTQIFSDLLSE